MKLLRPRLFSTVSNVSSGPLALPTSLGPLTEGYAFSPSSQQDHGEGISGFETDERGCNQWYTAGDMGHATVFLRLCPLILGPIFILFLKTSGETSVILQSEADWGDRRSLQRWVGIKVLKSCSMRSRFFRKYHLFINHYINRHGL